MLNHYIYYIHVYIYMYLHVASILPSAYEYKILDKVGLD